MRKTTLLLASLILTAITTVYGGQETTKTDGACGHKHGHAQKTERCNEACAVCLKCGELKGTDKCCNLEGREKCPACGLLKGSIGCCALPAGAEEASVCCKCGEIKGSEKCCDTGKCAEKEKAHECTGHRTHKCRTH